MIVRKYIGFIKGMTLIRIFEISTEIKKMKIIETLTGILAYAQAANLQAQTTAMVEAGSQSQFFANFNPEPCKEDIRVFK